MISKPDKSKTNKTFNRSLFEDLRDYFFVVSIRARNLLTSNLKAVDRVVSTGTARPTAPNYPAILLFPYKVGRAFLLLNLSGQPFFNFYSRLKLQNFFLHILYSEVIKHQPNGREGTVGTSSFPACYFPFYRLFEHPDVSADVLCSKDAISPYQKTPAPTAGKKARTGRGGIDETIWGIDQSCAIKAYLFSPGYFTALVFSIQSNGSARSRPLFFESFFNPVILKVMEYLYVEWGPPGPTLPPH
jgi:hypothetical protein